MLRRLILTFIVLLVFTESRPSTIAQRFFQEIKEFGFAANVGADPFGDLCLAADGMLYGLLENKSLDGGNGPTILYRVSTNGDNYEILKRFSPLDPGPGSSVIQGSDGVLYGFGWRTLYRIETDGSGYRAISLDSDEFGSNAHEASDGYIYTTTSNDGGALLRIAKDGTGMGTLRSFGLSKPDRPPIGKIIGIPGGRLAWLTGGAIYKIDLNGEGFEEIHRFSETGSNAYDPVGGLTYSKAGRLWGMTESGGISAGGVIYSLNLDGSDFRTEYVFPREMVDTPRFRLVEGSQGMMFGLLRLDNGSALFRFDPRTKEYKQTALPMDENGGFAYDTGGLVIGPGGALYGVAAGGANGDGILYTCDSNLEMPRVLREFSKLGGDGGSPVAFSCGSDGRVYGICRDGGKYNRGAVFSMDLDGLDYRILHSFKNIGEGYPSMLIAGADGWLYGFIRDEGAVSENHVFKLAADGSEFSIIQTLIGHVVLSLWQGADQTFFGSARCFDHNSVDCNSLFSLQPDGTELRFFGAIPVDLRYGMGEFTVGSDGAFYMPVRNEVYRITASGEVTIIKKVDFDLGLYPMTEGADGYLYGAVRSGFYRLNKDGSDYRFWPGSFWPSGRLLEVSPGVFYVTGYDGAAPAIVRFTVGDGSVTPVQRFLRLERAPIFGLQNGSDDLLFGITAAGDYLNAGTVFRYGPPTTQPELGIAAEPGQTGPVKIQVNGAAGALVRIQQNSGLHPGTWYDLEYVFASPNGSHVVVPRFFRRTFYRAILAGE